MTGDARRCLGGCGAVIYPGSRCPEQTYCGKPCCQRIRKTRWAREKRKASSSFRRKEREASRKWRKQNQSYWQNYRRNHPVYRKRERQRCIRRRRVRREKAAVSDTTTRPQPESAANMDASTPILTGTYLLRPVDTAANIDAMVVQLVVMPEDRDPQTWTPLHSGPYERSFPVTDTDFP